MRWLRGSLCVQAVLALYFQAIQWLPLGAWNTQCPSGDEIACGLGNQGISVAGFLPLSVLAFGGRLSLRDALYCLGITSPFWVFWLAYARAWRWLMAMQVAFYALWLALQIRSWWVPYIFGATESQAERYNNVLGQSTQLLPSFGRHLPPDGLHLVIQMLLLAVVVPGIVGLLKSRGVSDEL